MNNTFSPRLIIALVAIFLLGLAIYAAPTFLSHGVSWKTSALVLEGMGISLFIAPVSIFITLFYSTGKTERRIDDIWTELQLSERTRDQGGITRTYENRQPALAEFLSRCAHALEIDILGIALPQLTGSIPQLSEFAKHAKVRIAVIDPDNGPLSDCIEWMFPKIEAGTEQTARGNIEHLSTLHTPGGVQVYRYRNWPMASVMRADDVMFVSPYIYKLRGADSPTLRLVRQDRGIFDVYQQAFEAIIDSAGKNGKPSPAQSS